MKKRIKVSAQLESLVFCFKHQLETGEPLYPNYTVTEDDILTELLWCSDVYVKRKDGVLLIDDSPANRRRIDNYRESKYVEVADQRITSTNNDITIDGSGELIRISIFRK